MIDVELLKKIGYSDDLIDLYIRLGYLKKVEDNCYFLNKELLVQLFLSCLSDKEKYALELASSIRDVYTKNICRMYYYFYNNDIENGKKFLNYLIVSNADECLKNEIDNFDYILNSNRSKSLTFKYDSKEYFSFYYDLIRKYSLRDNYDVCRYVFDYLSKVNVNDPYFKIYFNVLSSMKSNVTYIVDTMADYDSVTMSGIKKMELKLLFDLEKEDYKNVGIDLAQLKYISNDSTPFEIISLLIFNIRKLQSNFKLISSHDFRGGFGTCRDVILGLLNSGDYYRVKEMIYEYYNKDEYLFEFELYKVLIDRIMELNKRNENYVKREIESSISANNMNELLSKYPVSTITIDTVNSVSESEEVIDPSINYYSLYQDLLKKGDYTLAKSALIKFKKKLKSIGSHMDVDYLLAELNTLINLSQESDANKDNYYRFMDKALECIQNKEYINANGFIFEALKYVNLVIPKNYFMIAYNYMMLGDYNNALKYYLEADQYYVYPEDYVHICECLINLKKYNLVHNYVSKYDYYYPEENPYVYYMLAIAQAKLGAYDDALNSIDKVEVINVLINNITVSLDYEKDIIRSLRKNKDIIMFTIDDYVDYCLTDKDKKIKKEIDKIINDENFISKIKEMYCEDSQIEDKIEYLMSVIKILNMEDRFQDVYNLVSYIETMLDTHCISEKEKNEINKVMGLYKANFIYI